jgi:hypothetical protein
MSEALPQLPTVMGGLGLAIGRTPTLDDPRLSERYFPYLYRLLDGNISQAQSLEVLATLDSIWRPSNKGFNWDSLEIDVMSITERLQIVSESEAFSNLPDWLIDKHPLRKLDWVSKNKGLISLMQLANELLRRHNFLKWWKGEIPPPSLLRFNSKAAGDKHRQVWEKLRKELEPSGRPFWVTDVKKLTKALEQITFGNFFYREDPAIRDAFDGMPSLFFMF